MKKTFINPNFEVVSFETEEAVTVSVIGYVESANTATVADQNDFSTIVVETFFAL